MTRTTTNYPVAPVTKPRMTQRDKWLKPARPAVAKYWAYKDEVKAAGIIVPESGSHITFYIKMPKSWSKKDKLKWDGKPHQTTPDKDNLEKALLDAIYKDDSHIWDSRVTKVWALEGSITIKT